MRQSKVEWDGIESDIYSTIDIDKLNSLFLDYINYGGYPEVAFSSRMQEDPGQFVRHDIVDKVLLRDLPSLYGISDVQELNSLFTMIAYHSGMEFRMKVCRRNRESRRKPFAGTSSIWRLLS